MHIYYVDGETQTTEKEDLSVERILEKVGIPSEASIETSALLWEVRERGPVAHNDLAEVVHMEDGMEFVTLTAALSAILDDEG